jgi:hypothetical protein
LFLHNVPAEFHASVPTVRTSLGISDPFVSMVEKALLAGYELVLISDSCAWDDALVHTYISLETMQSFFIFLAGYLALLDGNIRHWLRLLFSQRPVDLWFR